MFEPNVKPVQPGKAGLPEPLSTVMSRYWPRAPIAEAVYSFTSAGSVPVYVSVIQAWTVSPGFFPLTLYMAAPASLSERTTVPDANWLLSFDVVLENAENVPIPATADTRPTAMSERRTFFPLFSISPLFILPPFWTGIGASPTWGMYREVMGDALQNLEIWGRWGESCSRGPGRPPQTGAILPSGTSRATPGPGGPR